MKKNGRLTKAEENAVWKALGIIDGWTEAHMSDEKLPPNFWDIYGACRDLKNYAWAMTEHD